MKYLIIAIAVTLSFCCGYIYGRHIEDVTFTVYMNDDFAGGAGFNSMAGCEDYLKILNGACWSAEFTPRMVESFSWTVK